MNQFEMKAIAILRELDPWEDDQLGVFNYSAYSRNLNNPKTGLWNSPRFHQ